ncbi:unnamed protein product [Prunus armeniaca]|uniref:Uncharacterized protein n=1 Tax=Prunus armeniaca TaxID=36596 RepID=A0A6J5UT02_PRUAR|nr:unnamed protein product [Prunus armeniaca]
MQQVKERPEGGIAPGGKSLREHDTKNDCGVHRYVLQKTEGPPGVHLLCAFFSTCPNDVVAPSGFPTIKALEKPSSINFDKTFSQVWFAT